MIRYLTAGESHGKGMTIIIDGIPANLKISQYDIDSYLADRQKGYGRGGRQKIEKDTAEILSGIRFGKTTGSPISVFIRNRDFTNWQRAMSIAPVSSGGRELYVPRPGHADLPGGMKYNQKDFRTILERASARETAARIVAGAVAKKLLAEFGIDILGYVISIGGTGDDTTDGLAPGVIRKKIGTAAKKVKAYLRSPDITASGQMVARINEAAEQGDTLGGIIKVVTSKLPAGLGSHTQWDKKLDARISAAVISIQSVKGVEFGAGFVYTEGFGTEFHDSIYHTRKKGFFRVTNSAGGFEGGMTNGEQLVLKAAVKPISTVRAGLDSVNVKTKKKVKTIYERSDVCAVPAASLIAEAVTAVELASALMEKTGGDDITLMKSNFKTYMKHLKSY